jgi:predicted DsbA family dithiol-disulfide isomerase
MGDSHRLAGTRGDSADLRIDIVSDAICPWCYIGKRQLERALALLAAEGMTASVDWHPFQLNPDMPKAGGDRAQYRAAKFGSAERARERDAEVAAAAAGVGLTFRPDLITRTPNTLDAHRLIWLAGVHGVQGAAMEAVFAAYFSHGRDIGDHTVLAACGVQAGLDEAEVAAFLASDEAVAATQAADRAVRDAGVNGVPSFFLDGHGLWSGALPAETMAEALLQAHAILKQRAEA